MGLGFKVLMISLFSQIYCWDSLDIAFKTSHDVIRNVQYFFPGLKVLACQTLVHLWLTQFPTLVNQVLNCVVMFYMRFRYHFHKFLCDLFCIFTFTMKHMSHQKHSGLNRQCNFQNTLTCIHTAHSLWQDWECRMEGGPVCHLNCFVYLTYTPPAQCSTLLAQMQWNFLLILYFSLRLHRIWL